MEFDRWCGIQHLDGCRCCPVRDDLCADELHVVWVVILGLDSKNIFSSQKAAEQMCHTLLLRELFVEGDIIDGHEDDGVRDVD